MINYHHLEMYLFIYHSIKSLFALFNSLIYLCDALEYLIFLLIRKSMFINVFLNIAEATFLVILLAHCCPITNHLDDITFIHFIRICMGLRVMQIIFKVVMDCYFYNFFDPLRIFKPNPIFLTSIKPC